LELVLIVFSDRIGDSGGVESSDEVEISSKISDTLNA
jgi:hypothetical protein